MPDRRREPSQHLEQAFGYRRLPKETRRRVNLLEQAAAERVGPVGSHGGGRLAVRAAPLPSAATWPTGLFWRSKATSPGTSIGGHSDDLGKAGG